MDKFIGFMQANAMLLEAAAGLLVSLAAIWAFREGLAFWLTDLKYGMPLFGKIGRLAKNRMSSANGSDGWTASEKELCADYRSKINVQDEKSFEKGIAYLHKAMDLDTKPLPGWGVGVLLVMIALEGMGFSYLLGQWLAMDGSANIHMVLMVAIVILLCILLGYLTHSAGHALKKWKRVKKCYDWFQTDEGTKNLGSKGVTLTSDQSIDDHEPEYVQCVNRVGNDKSFPIVAIVAFVFIIAVGVLSTYMRYEHLKGQLSQEASQSSSQGNPFADGMPALPDQVASSQKKADEAAQKDQMNDNKDEGMAAFATLAFVFLATQFVGLMFGYSHGFAGRQSKEAYALTRGFATYEEYLNHYNGRIMKAESRLQELQQKMMENSMHKTTFSNTFADYVVMQGKKSATAALRSGSSAQRPAEAQAAAVEAVSKSETFERPEAVVENKVSKEVQKPSEDGLKMRVDFEAEGKAREISALGSDEEKKAAMLALRKSDLGLYERVKEVLRRWKEESNKADAAELDELNELF